MKVYVVFNPRFEFLEVYKNEPRWDEQCEMWVGRDFLEVIEPHELPDGVARKARHSGRAIKCHAQLDIVYEVEEEEEK